MLFSGIVSDARETRAWIEFMDGRRFPIEGNTSIGRAPGNLVVLNEEKVSRRHATINPQANGDYLFIDLGSSNGSYVNGRRVWQPCSLNHGDRIEIGTHNFSFHHPDRRPDATMQEAETEKTIQDVRSRNCWLLVADIEGSTQLLRRIPQEEVTNRTTQWLAECRALIEDHDGIINKFLGDGFFAYWRESPTVDPMVADAVKVLLELQGKNAPRFRLVLHHGRIFVGGAASLGEESLLGNEVNFVFRMEKVAASLGSPCLFSAPARERLAGRLNTEESCRSHVSGFDGEYVFYAPST